MAQFGRKALIFLYLVFYIKNVLMHDWYIETWIYFLKELLGNLIKYVISIGLK